MGPDAQLTLSPSKRNVIWAVEESPGRWGVTEVAPLTLIARVSWTNFDDQLRAEVKPVLAAVLPADPEGALAMIAQHLNKADEWVSLLHAIREDLSPPDRDPLIS
ncbi:hypothetical protein [Streptomyces formicae]|uniref:Uncharacterized protein n=1 Tax=Streptomyces formicae TaxID=1616117 RepID=A0A291QKM6_9ACTN|nr:hypothetical protein [Streptomyces formicae]ATL32259.1 hypothetical protein KY5_7241 [Streptomyces formicae]